MKTTSVLAMIYLLRSAEEYVKAGNSALLDAETGGP